MEMDAQRLAPKCSAVRPAGPVNTNYSPTGGSSISPIANKPIKYVCKISHRDKFLTGPEFWRQSHRGRRTEWILMNVAMDKVQFEEKAFSKLLN